MRVIGTAGHVDHGKSTLIAALTGTHPDRLKEEQAREMTIELGFGWMTLPNGEEIGIVDVPGHRDFIENMLSGVGGIDAALLVIAADEGIMPQTKEHLAILDLLQIPAGLIVLTKTDLASDSGWLDLLETDIRHAVSFTALKDAPIIRVSAKNKTGLDSLLSNLQSLLENKPNRADLNRPRLPIDRAFTMSGFGTVVTGTLSNGHLSVGDEVEILPSGLKGRVRGLQTHKKKEETALPGSRTAVNISGVDVDSIQRGDVVTRPNQYVPIRRIDARFNLLADASAPLKHNDEVKIFIGASETIGIARLLGKEELIQGEEGWLQIELRDPVVAVRGDRYILRRPSPSETLGGGAVIDPNPKGRHKRFDEDVLRSLDLLLQGSPADVLYEAALALNIAPLKELIARSRLEGVVVEDALKELVESGKLLMLGDDLVAATLYLMDVANKAAQIVNAHHVQFPLRRGVPKEELKSKLKLTPRIFNAFLAYQLTSRLLRESGALIAMPGHEVKFNGQDQAKVQGLIRKFEKSPYATPSVKECQSEIGAEVYSALVEMNELIAVSIDVVFRTIVYEAMVNKIKETTRIKGQITLAETRDLFDTTRKYAQAILEHLDALGITVRSGDARVLK